MLCQRNAAGLEVLFVSESVARVRTHTVKGTYTAREALDLMHGQGFVGRIRVTAGGYADLAACQVIVVSAGAAQKPGETRLDLVKKNTAIFKSIVPQVAQHNPDGIILVAANPVDVLSYAAWKLSGLPAARVIGSGTILDTARFRYLLSQHYGVDPRSVHAFIIGEHGDSEVPVWSLANIAGMRLTDFCCLQNAQYDQARMDEIFVQTRDAAYAIIQRKGATFYAIGSGLMRIVEAILRDQSTVLSVSSLIDQYYGIDDVYLSLPTVINRGGVEALLRQQLEEMEIVRLRRSADVLKAPLAQLEL
jgi:L-lactate dehydrogenase